jgi:hypothetical protein
MKSIENDRELAITSKNPFHTERRLYDKKDFSSGDIAVTVVVPDFYHVALPNLGHQMVEHQLAQTEGIYADRSYLCQFPNLLHS